MLEIPLIIAWIIYFIFALFIRFRSEKALADLTDEDRGRLVRLFQKDRKYQTYFMLGIMGIFVVTTLATTSLEEYSSFFWVVLLLGYVITKQVGIKRKIGHSDFPESYKSVYKQNQTLQLVGLFVLALGWLVGYLN
jgi:surface polysaccharide O-acyltransferase-like enzyme